MTEPLNNNYYRQLCHGIHLFNHAYFFDAHEVLEDVWRSVPRHQILRLHLQAMVQLAVAFHHASTGNPVGARSVLERALRNLKDAESSFPNLDLAQLRADLTPWQSYLQDAGSVLNQRREIRQGEQGALSLKSPPLPAIRTTLQR
jgi:predicted metal-dependent hydrolase